MRRMVSDVWRAVSFQYIALIVLFGLTIVFFLDLRELLKPPSLPVFSPLAEGQEKWFRNHTLIVLWTSWFGQYEGSYWNKVIDNCTNLSRNCLITSRREFVKVSPLHIMHFCVQQNFCSLSSLQSTLLR